MQTLQRYRTDDGLYRTWLAPQKQFECIDPGSDPNPPDIGIQIHILLWLAHASQVRGRLTLDAGAVRAVTQRNASLLEEMEQTRKSNALPDAMEEWLAAAQIVFPQAEATQDPAAEPT